MATAAAAARKGRRNSSSPGKARTRPARPCAARCAPAARPWSTRPCAARASWSPRSRSRRIGGGGKVTREGHRALHAPARDDDEGRRAAAAVVRHRRQGRTPTRRWRSCCIDIKTDVETGSPLAAGVPQVPAATSTPCTATWWGPASRPVFSRRCSTAWRSTRKRSSPSRARSRRRCSIRSPIIAVAFIVTAVIMIFVIPAFKQVFTSFGADLPAPTLIVMAISDCFVALLVHHLPA